MAASSPPINAPSCYVVSKMEAVTATLAVKTIQTIVYLYDFVTYPLYYFVQRPWVRKAAAESVRAYPVSRADGEITYKPVDKTCPELEAFEAAGVDTMDECLNFAVRLHSHKRMLGTRQILNEVDQVQPNGKVFKKWDMGEYHWKTYLQVDEVACSFGKGLRETGLNAHDMVCIFAETKEEWLICALGCFKQTLPLVTLYANLGEDAIVYGINESEVTHVITSHDLLPKFKSVLNRTPAVKVLIFLEDQIHATNRSGYKADVDIMSFQEVVAKGKHSKSVPVKPTKLDPAIIMYTSGSTGAPKGVILPHEALITTIKAFHFVVNPPSPTDIYLAYLPLAHILELLSEMTMIIQGIPVGYSSPNTMIDKSTKVNVGNKGDCSVLRPTLMCAVPMVIDRIYKGIQENINAKGFFFKKLMAFLYQYKSDYRKIGMRTPILDFLIFRKMSNLVGGRIRLLLCGGAPLSPDIHDYVRNALELILVQGYGLTESCACGTIMDADEMSTGRVGPPLQGVQVKLIDWDEGNYKVIDTPNPRGEVVLGGSNVALGYFKLANKTAEDFFTDDQGTRWFRTGDIGEIYPDGTLKIIDRKKDLVKLQFGEYVSLGKVESVLKTCSVVDNICMYGNSNHSFCVALVLPDHTRLAALADTLQLGPLSIEDICASRQMNAEVLQMLQQHGKDAGLLKFELPAVITLCPEVWTPDTGLVTAAFKLRRKRIEQQYQKLYDRMYRQRPE